MRKENTKLKGKYKLCAFNNRGETVTREMHFRFSLKIFGMCLIILCRYAEKGGLM